MSFLGLRMRAAGIMLAFFGLMTAIAAYYPFSGISVQSRPAKVLHDIIDALFVSWLGEENTVFLLGALTILLPILCLLGVIKSHSERQIRKGMRTEQPQQRATTHTPNTIAATSRTAFGKRS